MQYADESLPFPAEKKEGQKLCAELGDSLHELLARFEQKNRDAEESKSAAKVSNNHIVGSMQRDLPTTLCAVLMRTGMDAADQEKAKPSAAGVKPLTAAKPMSGSPKQPSANEQYVDACFLWAGDSRGYALDADGLHQLTSDDVRGEPDALSSLYRDVPLGNLLSADEASHLNARRVRLHTPCLVICATDGVFGCLQTPMEFEMLLLSTMNAASGMDNWRHKLEIAFSRLATDDATLTCAAYGFESFAQMNRSFAARRDLLRRRFIEPVRAGGEGMEIAQEKWSEYRTSYDWTEGSDDETDWRL